MNKIKVYNKEITQNILKLSHTVKRLTLYVLFISKHKSLNIKRIEREIYIIKSYVDDIEKIILNTNKH